MSSSPTLTLPADEEIGKNKEGVAKDKRIIKAM
jgi:hypothetical protein